MTTETQPDLAEFWKLLLEFRALPETRNSKTLMEVSGYPHYENVCTNILEFYFNPEEEHGLKDLLIQAFFRTVGVTDKPSVGKVTLHPQQPTAKGNYIDLVIDSESFTIGVENKIHHHLHNDLEDYANTINRMAANKSLVRKVVLGLERIQNKDLLKGGFVSFTYRELWQQTRELLGHYLPQANLKWVSYLLDFMQTTTNLAGDNIELKQSDKFFIDNHETIDRLVAERDAFHARLAYRLNAMAGLMNEPEVLSLLQGDPHQAATLEKAPWVWQKQCIVFNFLFPNKCVIAFDLWLSAQGWGLDFFGRDNERSRSYLNELIQLPPLSLMMAGKKLDGTRYVVERWPEIQSDPAQLKSVVCCWLKALIEAGNSLASKPD